MWGDFMIKKMFVALFASIVLSILWLGFIILTNQKTEFKSEIDRQNMKESRIEYNENKFSDEQISNSYNGFSLIPSSIKYDLITKFYTASNSQLIASYNINNKQIRLELTFKADGYWFLYHGGENEIAYEGEYKLVDKTIYAKVNRIYKSNKCYEDTSLISEFDIIEKNGRKVTNLMINDIEFIEINKKLLTETNEKFAKKSEIGKC